MAKLLRVRGWRRGALLFILAALATLSFGQAPGWFREFGNNQNTSVSAGSGCTGAPLWFENAYQGSSEAGPVGNLVAGPEGNLYGIGDGFGANDNVVYALDSATGKVKWTAYYPSPNLPAIGKDGTVYISSTSFSKGVYTSSLYALDPSSGTQEWSYLLGTGTVDVSPVIDGKGTVYCYSTDNTVDPPIFNLLALSGQTGALIWSVTRTSTYGIAGFPRRMALSPDETHLYFDLDYLYAFDTADGSFAWEWEPSPQNGATSQPVVGPDGTVYIYFLNPVSISAVDGQSGDLKWTVPFCFYNGLPSLSPDGRTLYVSTEDPPTNSTPQLEGLDTSNGSVVLSMNFAAGQATDQPIGYPSRMAVGSDGTLYVVDLESDDTGSTTLLYAINPVQQSILWCTPTAPGATFPVPSPEEGGASYTFWGPTISANGTIYAFAEDSATKTIGIAAFGTNSVASVYSAASSVAGGASAEGVVQLSQATGPMGASVTLTSSNPIVQVSNVVVPSGAKARSFLISAQPVSQAKTVTITAQYGGAAKTLTLTVTPAALSYIYVSPASVSAGSDARLVVQLGGKTGSNGATVNLSSSSALVSVPTSATVPSGSAGVSLLIRTSNVASPTNVTVTATQGAIVKQTSVTLVPNKLENFYVSPGSVIAGSGARGVAQIQLAAGAGGNTISLKSGTAAVQAPSSITIPSGSTGVSFPITTTQVSATLGVRLTATFGPFSLQTTLTVYPGLARVYASPASVVGGQSTHGVVQLGGVSTISQAVALSANSSLVSLPSTVTVAAGTSGVSFTIQTKSVTTATSVSITAKEGASTKTMTIMLNP